MPKARQTSVLLDSAVMEFRENATEVGEELLREASLPGKSAKKVVVRIGKFTHQFSHQFTAHFVTCFDERFGSRRRRGRPEHIDLWIFENYNVCIVEQVALNEVRGK
jgi:hypothetical protein